MKDHLKRLIQFIYGPQQAAQVIEGLQNIKASLPSRPDNRPVSRTSHFDHRDTILITYGDMVHHPGERPLQTLHRFLRDHIASTVRGVHLLPFYPYTSDDGFSVIDYQAVDPALGDWADVRAFQHNFRLMFDAVINHISQESRWFQGFLNGEEPYTNYFVAVDPQADLSAVFRPRALPLLTPFETADGQVHVWTTFSADQIDLNYASPEVLLEIIRTLLFYAENGAEMIRLDAIGFMWKEIGTTSLHLPQTHALIQAMRAFLDDVAPHVALITETNVPHQDNISYFGDGTNEAQMVYNFSLPPLTLHAFHSENAETLSRWAAGLTLPSKQVTFFNFLASHDGIGVTPVRGILSSEAIDEMAVRVERLNGYVSYKSNSNGSQSAYELNINYLDALGDPAQNDPEEIIAGRFICAQAIMLALRGVPGIYFHSLFGSRSWRAGAEASGQKRRINREKLSLKRLEAELASGLRQLVFGRYLALLTIRTAEKAFSPYGEQDILTLHPAVFAVQRQLNGETILCLHNVSRQVAIVLQPFNGTNLISGESVAEGPLTLAGYEAAWIKR